MSQQALTNAAHAQQSLSRYVVPNYGRLELVPERGQGSYLWDAAGQKYLDFGGGVAVTSLGHCPEVIQQALQTQAAKLIHCSNWYQIAEQGLLGEFLVNTVMQEAGKCLFCNSGAEANECLLKLARKFGHTVPQATGEPRTEIITFHNSFHGRTYGGISATAQQKVKEGFGPLVPGFVHLEFNNVGALRQAVGHDTVAILLEIVQGEGGVNIATEAFLAEIQALCQEWNLLLLVDEVQAGFGRCGSWCSWKAVLGENATLVPDAVSWAKGIAGGFPMGAAWIRQRPLSETLATPLCDLLGPGSHGTTFGGTPLACAVALAVLHEIQKKDLNARVAALGEKIMATVRSWNSPLIAEVRGAGFLLGFELNPEKLAQSPLWTAGATPSLFMVKALMRERLLTVGAGANVVRWLPPLNVSEKEIAEALGILKRTLEQYC